jgi:hypothetical protein
MIHLFNFDTLSEAYISLLCIIPSSGILTDSPQILSRKHSIVYMCLLEHPPPVSYTRIALSHLDSDQLIS